VVHKVVEKSYEKDQYIPKQIYKVRNETKMSGR